MTSPALVRHWPAAGVRARSGDLELRWIDDDLLVALADVAARGIHEPSRMPFFVPWTRGDAETVARRVLTYQWGVRGQIGPERLVLELAVLVDGTPVGIQGASGDDWGVLRRVETGSWLGIDHQARGIGTRMRALMLFALFDGLDAREVTSGAFADNPASNAVSRRVGYEANGVTTIVREGEAADHNNYLMRRDRFEHMREANLALLGAPVELEGFDAVRAAIASS